MGKSLAIFGTQCWISIAMGVVILVALLVPLGRLWINFQTRVAGTLKRSWGRVNSI